MWKLILIVGVLGQYDDVLDKSYKVKRFPPSPPMQARILEASIQAQFWAAGEAEHLYPGQLLYNPRLSANYHNTLKSRKQEVRYLLKMAAYKQIAEAYDIDLETLGKIMRDPLVKLIPFTKEILPNDPPPGTIRMATSPFWRRPTRFDPSKVRLSRAMAIKHRYPIN